MAKTYTHATKGGEYELIGTSSGAGQRKGDVVQVYRSTKTGKIHHREPEDFAMRMKPLEPNVDAHLLAALLQAREWVAHEAFGVDTRLAQLELMDHVIAAAKGEV